MAKTKATRKHVIISLLFVTVFLLFVVLPFFALWLRKEINNTEVLRSYRINYEDSASESAELLKRLCRDKLSVRLYPASSHSHLYLHLASTREAAEALGFPLDALEAGGFLIARQGNGLYLLSDGNIGLSRACHYLTSRLTDKAGNLLIGQDQRYVDTGAGLRKIYGPGGVPLTDYQILCSKSLSKTAALALSYYLNQSCGALPVISDRSADASGGSADAPPSIVLVIDPSLSGAPHSITFAGSDILIAGINEAALLEGIGEFANTCLGWMYAGTGREKLSDGNAPITLASAYGPADEVWIAEREPIITLWNVNYSRGTFLNDSTSLKTDIMSFSDEQLYEYVRMLKYCGFTGIQVTDMCSAWAGAGSYEFVHERIRILADAAHSLGMNFTLWVWGSEFTGYGWVDNSVTYSFEGFQYAYENPDVVASFEKYYSIYAELADCCDRVIAHYYDPGNLHQSEDVAYFAKMLADKFLAVNPGIDFGVSCWVDKFDKNAFVAALGSDVTLYEAGHQEDETAYNGFRGFCRERGVRLGTWAWNTCEMEIDQLAQMNFQPHIIQSVYQTAARYDEIVKPGYWSEMDSNHVINVFSLYCAGQLLIDPSRTPEELTDEIALAAAGPEYAAAFADVLRLIEDARSGESWNTYWWSSEDYLLKSDAYPAEEILAESERALAVLNEMIDQDVTSHTLPLPLAFRDVLRLMVPQVAQIKAFAEFRIGLSEAEKMLRDGSPAEAVQAKLKAISTPVSEYNTVTGLWGQIEARAQQEMLAALCEANGFETPMDPAFRQARKNRIYDYFVSYQKGSDKPVLQYAPYFQYGVAYGQETTTELVAELVEEGLFSVDETTGGIYLTDWEHYQYSFN